MIHIVVAAAAAMAALALAAPAQAHVTLEVGQAPGGGAYKAVFRVPHGCGGSPTIGLTVRMPDGVTGAKPQPKPGWDLAVDKIGGAVREISWRGRLDDAHFDEFVVFLRLPDAPHETLSFPVVQRCETGEGRWSPTLHLMPAEEGEPHHH